MKVKTIIGIMLIIVSLAALVFWEVSGREAFTTKPVLAAAGPVPKGTVLGAAHLKVVRISAEECPADALAPGSEALLLGKAAAVALSENQPLTKNLVKDCSETFQNGQSVFSVPPEWIYSRPAFLRAGDRVAVYTLPEKEKLGSFEIAYVRDSTEQAVLGDELPDAGVLGRNSASGIIASVELLCKPSDYFTLYERAQAGPPALEQEAQEGDPEAEEPSESQRFGWQEQDVPEPEAFLLLVLEEAAK